MARSPNLEIINRSTTRPALDIDDLAQGGNIVIIKRNRVPVLWVDEEGVLHCSEAIDAPGSGGGGGSAISFEYAGSMDGADIWAPAAAAIGFDDSLQNDALRVWVSLIDAEGEAWFIYRENVEGWGVGYSRIAGTNPRPQAGTYTVLGLWVTNV